MAAVVISNDVLKTAKKQLAIWYPQASSSAVTEALARALGYRTNAALRAAMKAPSQELEKIRLFEPGLFIERLRELSDGAVPIHGEEKLIDLDVSLGEMESDDIFPTRRRKRAKDEVPTAPLDVAWQRIMVAAANAGIRQGRFTMRAGRKPETDETGWYEFEIDGHPARCRYTIMAPKSELQLDVMIWPVKPGDEAATTGFASWRHLGEVIAVGWFERTHGSWLQANPILKCRNPKRLLTVQAFQMERPLGFAPLGLAYL